jgi:thioredoxin 1
MGSKMVKVINGNEFALEVIEKSKTKPVLVEFGAEWCGPCKTFGKVLEEISNDMGNDIDIVKIDIDQNPDLATEFKIRSIPCSIIFKNGENKSQQLGALQKQATIDWIKSI